MSGVLRILMRKEWKQLTRSKGAMATGLLLPILFLLLIPGGQIVALKMAPSRLKVPQGDASLPHGLAAMATDPSAMLRLFILPLMVTVGGLIVPSMAATYTIISERETRTLELLVALPVRVTQVLAAKLLVIGQLALAVTGILFLVDAALLLGLGLASVGYVLSLGLLLVGALGYSTSAALLIGLLGKDYRTANNINGVLFVPTLFLTMGMLLLIPGESVKLLVLAVALLGLAAVATLVAMKVVTFERLMR